VLRASRRASVKIEANQSIGYVSVIILKEDQVINSRLETIELLDRGPGISFSGGFCARNGFDVQEAKNMRLF
jgi:hypothetical protein